ncbi:triacylglycerol lipase [Cellulomonas sp. C5510]|uniref:esterase/lipase family protein n=1 Tax=Cellulomonas sp. C5510 TaxID=2871170 RepID=UPI001C9579AD|nr:alpha/beta hydrolase [Cellulomonas sp. C5510]QZN84694.1 alpha/beta hydrolase [Cellulomonas sp. C5510]
MVTARARRRPAEVAARTAWRVLDYGYAGWRQAAALLSRTPPGAWAHPAARRPPEVLLLPGVWEPWRFLEPLGGALHARGHAVHVVPGLGFNGGGLPEMTELAADRVRELDLRGAVVVAHSKGGLIGKALLGRADVRDRLRGMVAVNTPFAGSPYARWLPVPALRAFLPDDEVLTALAAQRADHGRIVAAATRWDPHIPGDGALPGARLVRLRTPGHFLPLCSAELRSVVAAELDRFAASHPGADGARTSR